MTLVGTPDYQRGVVSAQKLLATVSAPTATVTVGIPPNAETLVVMFNASAGPVFFNCVGVTSGFPYPRGILRAPSSGGQYEYLYFDVSNAVDAQVTISTLSAVPNNWYVYSDSGQHIQIDPSTAAAFNSNGNTVPSGAILVGGTDGSFLWPILTNRNGVQYVVPVAPDLGTGDHPPVELACAGSGSLASGFTVIAAPGASKRLRLFSAMLFAITAGQEAALLDSISTVQFISAPTSPSYMSFAPSGLALTANAAVTLTTSGGNAGCSVTYTSETI